LDTVVPVQIQVHKSFTQRWFMLALFPEIAACAQTGDLEKLSVMVRQYFAGDDAAKPSLDADDLVRNFGIPVQTEFLDFHGAIAVADVKGEIKATFLINKSLNHETRQFTLCHLLGHFVLHIQPALTKGEWKSSGFKEEFCPLGRYASTEGLSGMSAHEFAAEDLADRFAGALLMPAAMVSRAMEKLGDVAKVAQVFGVSAQLVARRLDDLTGKQTDSSALRAGARILKNNTANASQQSPATLRSDEVPPSQLIRDVNQVVPPTSRVIATHSYNDAAHGEHRPREREDSELKGMARIRELARKLDKFGDGSK
jgi:Zn-dependent peptidase ImmA (M78 family)